MDSGGENEQTGGQTANQPVCQTDTQTDTDKPSGPRAPSYANT